MEISERLMIHVNLEIREQNSTNINTQKPNASRVISCLCVYGYRYIRVRLYTSTFFLSNSNTRAGKTQQTAFWTNIHHKNPKERKISSYHTLASNYFLLILKNPVREVIERDKRRHLIEAVRINKGVKLSRREVTLSGKVRHRTLRGQLGDV